MKNTTIDPKQVVKLHKADVHRTSESIGEEVGCSGGHVRRILARQGLHIQRMDKSAELVAWVREDPRRGPTQAAKQFGVSRASAHKWLDEAGLDGDTRRQLRDNQILEAAQPGMTLAEIAEAAGASVSQVHRVVGSNRGGEK